MSPDPEPTALSDEAIAGRFAVNPVDDHVVSLQCGCGAAAFYAEQPWIRGARDHAESGDCRLGRA